jgi:SHS2 domain-containing protein
MKYRFLSHTADLKIRVYGKNLNQIINNSLLALKDFLKPKLKKNKLFYLNISASGFDYQEALISFLSEVLAKTYIKKIIFFKLLRGLIYKNRKNQIVIKGKIVGYRFNFLQKDIKAITYHQVILKKWGENLIFEFVVDI